MMAEGTQLLRNNLARAVELLGDFHQVATDQASEQRRQFDSAEMVSEVLPPSAPVSSATRIASRWISRRHCHG